MQYVYCNADYPPQAVAAKVEGIAVISFKVEVDGRINDPKLLRDPGYGLGKAALAPFQKMINDDLRWEPARTYYGGEKPVKVQFNFPVRFSLSPTPLEDGRPAVRPPAERIYLIADEMPIFPGCDKFPASERKQCSDQALIKFILGELIIPEVIRQNCFSGSTVVSFVVNKVGHIEQAEILRGPIAGLGNEVIRAIGLMNKRQMVWAPGRNGGKAVNVRLTFPLHINLK
ncbi:energy transducer TonB [Lewinella sp. 4G2]|uniref:energy transducer TonB n=1 Tax=Lewinella sp. 4G2 TaxID=1803372 RepID=UPI0007B4C3E0|nr:energy transducer TonB [Lewinella sp. 4G2]OAV44171.1 hypothetical protein A3850_006525 [Lewinella sp. 4G2]